MLNERLQIVLNEDDKKKLMELAEENTGSNNSLLIRRLISEAWQNPKKFGLYVPKADGLGQLIPAHQ